VTDACSPAAVSLLAPAKVNLYLGIHEGHDAEGYHQADSVMVALGICDEVTITPAEGLTLTCEPLVDAPDSKNTAWRAAELLANELGREPNAHISLVKHVPFKAGLGGASSDAAAVLRGMCQLWGVDVDDPCVVEVAKRVGADVPFFLDCRPSLLVGRGDDLARVFEDAPELHVALVRPEGDGVSTPAAYAEFDREPAAAPGPDAMCQALEAGDARGVAAALCNNLEPAAARLAPEIAEVGAWLVAQPGVLGAQLSGSGSCSFAICEDVDAAQVVAAAAVERGWWSAAVRSLASLEDLANPAIPAAREGIIC